MQSAKFFLMNKIQIENSAVNAENMSIIKWTKFNY